MSHPTLEQIVWQGLGSSPESIMWVATLGVSAQSLMVGVILSMTATYFGDFGRDPLVVRIGVGLGSLLATTLLVLSLVQAFKLAHYHADNIDGIVRFDQFAILAQMVIGAIFSWFTTIFYSWRAWKWWIIAPLSMGIAATVAMVFPVVAHGFKMPHVSIERLEAFGKWTEDQGHISVAWGSVNLSVDSLICLTSIFFLLYSRTSRFHSERRIFQRIALIIFESMAPAVIALLILVSSLGRAGSPLVDYRRVVISIVVMVYYYSLLYSLVSRGQIRDIVDARFEDSTGAKVERVVLSPRTDTPAIESGHKIAAQGSSSERDVEQGKDFELKRVDSVAPLVAPLHGEEGRQGSGFRRHDEGLPSLEEMLTMTPGLQKQRNTHSHPFVH